MTVFQELLILIGAPVLVTVAVYAAVYLRNPRPQSRYRPGEAYEYKPVWFVARPEALGAAETGSRTAIEARVGAEDEDGLPVGGPKGGAHGQW
jgi:hypothetical protein